METGLLPETPAQPNVDLAFVVVAALHRQVDPCVRRQVLDSSNQIPAAVDRHAVHGHDAVPGP